MPNSPPFAYPMFAASLLAASTLVPPATSAPQDWLSTARYFPEADKESVGFQSLGDIDNDGDIDVMAAQQVHTGYQVFLNQSGELGALPFQTLPQSSLTEMQEGLADIDGDGNLDAFYSYYLGGSQLRVLPGNGNGTFGAPIIIALEASYVDHALADIDNDGDTEIAIANERLSITDDVLIRWWDWQAGAMIASTAVVIPKGSPDGVSTLAALDANSDSVPDLVVASKYGTKLHVLLTATGAPTNPLPTVPVPFPGNIEVWIHAGDLNGDGFIDVLAGGRQFGAGAAVFDYLLPMYNTGGGSFTAGPLTTLNQTDYYTRIAYIDDWDGDGDGDVFLVIPFSVAQSEYNGVGVLDNDGTGNLKQVAFYHTGAQGGGAGLADMDGDGTRDFVGSRCIVYGTGRPAMNEPEWTHGGITGFLGPALGFNDLDDDGDLDVIRDTGTIVRNNAAGRFNYPSDIIQQWPVPPASHLYKDTIAVGDFDDDGNTDAVVKLYFFQVFGGETFVEMRLLLGDGRLGFVDAGPAAPPGENFGSELGFHVHLDRDIDGDGDVDLIGNNGYRSNDGFGHFSSHQTAWLGTPSVTGDIDNDGDLDVLTHVRYDLSTADLVLQQNNGAQTFTAQVLISTDDLSLVGGNLTDLDGDGDLDIACGRREGGAVYLFQNNGAGSFLPLTATSVHRQTDLVEAEDIDGDGLLDLVTAAVVNYQQQVEGDRIVVLRRTSSTQLTYEAPRVWVGASVRYLLDIDQDGDRDLVGGHVIRNKRYDGPTDGTLLQFGHGTPGSGGYVPLIGATGPLRTGSTTVTFRYRGGLGGAPVWLLSGLGTAAIPGPFPGATFYLNPIHHVLNFVAAGPPGSPGAGTLDFPVPPSALSIAAGATLYIQCFTADPGVPVGAAASQALEFVFGL